MSDKIRAQATFAMIPEWLLYSGVSDRAVRLFGALARHADKEWRATPGRQRLADLLGCSVDSIDRAKKELVAVGAIEVQHRESDEGDQDVNLYILHFVDPGVAAGLRPPSRTVAATGSRTVAAQTKALGNEITLSVPNGTSSAALVAFFVEESRRSGSDPPARVKGQAAQRIGQLVKEGRSEDVIRRAIEIAIERGLHPSALDSCVHQAELQANGNGRHTRRRNGMSASEILEPLRRMG